MTFYYKTQDETYLPVDIQLVPVPTEKEFLLVKIGDPETGWIPTQEDLDAVVKIFGEIMPGKENCALFYHYGIEVKVLQIPEGDILLVAKLGDPAIRWIPEQTGLDAVEAELKALFANHPNVKVKATYYDVEVEKEGE